MNWLLIGGGFLAVMGYAAKGKINDVITELPDNWTRFDSLFVAAEKKHGVDAKWLKAFALNESDLGRDKTVTAGLKNPDDVEASKSYDGLSWGLMQVTLKTGRDFDPNVTAVKLNNPAYSVDLAARLIAWLKKQFPVSDPRYVEWVVKSYNQGSGNTAKERAGKIKGYAQEYWDRFERNLARVNEKGVKR